MKNYICPDFWWSRKIYLRLLELQERVPDLFNKDVKIDRVFGAFPGLIWNGGGYNTRPTLVSLQDIQQTCEYFRLADITLQLTATNPSLIKEDCYDRYGNAILKYFNEYHHEVLVSTDIMESYIRDKYPNIVIDRSIINTPPDKEYDFISALESNKYNYIVLPRRYVKDWSYLDTIPEQLRSRVELLCNDPCPIDCPRLYSHYIDYSKITLFEESKENINVNCTTMGSGFRRLRCPEYQIFPEQVDEYSNKGYTLFKISGRSSAVDVVCGVVPFLIKPQYQVETIRELLTM